MLIGGGFVMKTRVPGTTESFCVSSRATVVGVERALAADP